MFLEDLQKLVADRPVYGEVLPKLMELEEAEPEGWLRPDWLSPDKLNLLKRRGVITVETAYFEDPNHPMHYQEGKFCRVVDPDVLVQFLTEQIEEEDWLAPLPRPDDFCAAVLHRDDIIEEFIESLDHPEYKVPILLIGPPASAKSVIFHEIDALGPRTYLTYGGNTTGEGFIQMLEDQDPLHAMVDEIDKMFARSEKKSRAKVTTALCSWMESSIVKITRNREVREFEQKGTFYAAGNDDEDIPPEIISRFEGNIFFFEEYLEDEFLEVATILLGMPRNGGLEEAMGEWIGQFVWGHPRGDIRMAMGLAKAARIAMELGKDPWQRIRSKAEKLEKYAKKI